MVETEPMT
jgi:hypothetical protein